MMIAFVSSSRANSRKRERNSAIQEEESVFAGGLFNVTVVMPCSVLSVAYFKFNIDPSLIK